MKTYNGHKNWNYWNVSLWISNDYGLYQMAKEYVNKCKGQGGKKAAASLILECLHDAGVTHTPDGAKYTKSSIQAAISDL